ncbi:MAG: DUF1566 domain-containing protein [Candidatus Thiodiazotropha sp.]
MNLNSGFLGWTALLLSTAAASFWAYWGIIEAFHEGWFKPQLGMRLLQLVPYLAPATGFCLLTYISLRWPAVGAGLYVAAGILIAVLIAIDRAKFPPLVITLLTLLPVALGLMFLYGRPTPVNLAYGVALGVPGLIILLFGAEPVYRVSTRVDDGDRGMRTLVGNGVNLQWAPAGPGWSRQGGVDWTQAMSLASRLSEDGLSLEKTPQNIWRLPTRDELVRSMTRGGNNAGGQWDPQKAAPRYRRKPDKESPLWDPYAPLIYLWTQEEADEKRAWLMVYHGGVYSHLKSKASPSTGFRAVRKPPEEAQP